VNIARDVSHLFNKTILISIGVHFIAAGGFSFTIIDSSLSEAAPDHSTIWRFRQLLNTENLLEPLLEQINHHLEQNSIIVSLCFCLSVSGVFL
jgi:hypothetical protein